MSVSPSATWTIVGDASVDASAVGVDRWSVVAASAVGVDCWSVDAPSGGVAGDGPPTPSATPPTAARTQMPTRATADVER
ncbi:hypothetical protein ACFQJD_13395 [Haloplanus sp. GCM10025708]|uniref:hypothetical protein n=1 Tax=Haloplanus sp. GCM10025708 TaxID=3252679 RepID=UPI0036209CFB